MRAEKLHRNARFHDPSHPQTEGPCADCIATAETMPPAPSVRTEWHDGLEFELPTWDPTAAPWNAAGSWAEDPKLTARIRATILAAIPNVEALLAEAETAVSVSTHEWCGTFWGSHGCGRAKNHPGLCVCDPDPSGEAGPCSAALKWGEGNTLIVWHAGDDGFWLSGLHWTWFA